MTAHILTSPNILKLLAHDMRWQIVRLLVTGDYQVNELVDQLGQPLNLVSYHLRQLRDGELVSARRSEADGRDTYYSVDLNRLRTLYRVAGAALHPLVVSDSQLSGPIAGKVLFVCTHNSARSQMAEGLMRHLSAGQIQVASAGSEPTHIHPDAVRTMQKFGIDIRGQHANSLDDYHEQTFDTVITVCDRAREVCPAFPGGGQQLHWGFTDPAAIDDEKERQQAFMNTALRLQSRIEYWLRGLQAGG
ncbi:MAG: ArsR family transcriptional regulator [Anaerolineaceae bacterium]|nr:ArsR family transcriptional regulator [Anaerolineaceae bacterium]